MKRLRWLEVLVCVTASCAAADGEGDGVEALVEDVVRGARDRGRHPAVVMLRGDDGTRCTATVVAPRAVLTARHCVALTTPEIRCPSRAAHVLVDRPASSLSVVTAEESDGAPALARGVRLVVPASRSLCGADVAVVVLDRALPVAPMRLEATARAGVGDAVAVVGYGLRGDGPRAGSGARFYRRGVRVLGASASELLTGAAACDGDSGGPAIDEATGRVVAVLSRGTERCVGDEARSAWTRASVAAGLVAAAR